MQERLAQVLLSLGAAQQAAAVMRGEVAHDSYYKVGRAACWVARRCEAGVAACAWHGSPDYGGERNHMPFLCTCCARRCHLSRCRTWWRGGACTCRCAAGVRARLRPCCGPVWSAGVWLAAVTRKSIACCNRHCNVSTGAQAGYAYVSKDQMSSLVVQPFR